MPFKGDILSESKKEWSRICAGLCRRRKTMTRKGELVEDVDGGGSGVNRGGEGGALRQRRLRGKSAEQQRRIRCLAMDGDLSTVILSPYFGTRYRSELAFQCHRFEVNQHHVADVMLVLLKSGQSTTREEAVEEMKDCRRDETALVSIDFIDRR
ncbi:hypothetical protein YC2023_081708 [Brassica napus]